MYLAPVPVLTALASYLCWRGLETRDDTMPFFAAVALFLLGMVGLAISNLPYLVPPSVTIWDAAAVPSSQAFMLVGTLVLLPVILATRCSSTGRSAEKCATAKAIIEGDMPGTICGNHLDCSGACTMSCLFDRIRQDAKLYLAVGPR